MDTQKDVQPPKQQPMIYICGGKSSAYLKSGEEGYYPELTEFCEKRLTGLAPESRALRKDKPAATSSSFTAEEWEKIDGDIKSWVSEIKKEDDKIHFHETETFPAMEDNLPPVRGSNSHLHVAKFLLFFHLRFDVEKECSKIDEDYKEKTVVNNKAHLSKIETRLDTAGLTEKEKDFLATREKEKGNEAFNSGDYEEAVMYYTRALELHPFSVKPLLRRAMAYETLEQYHKAYVDYKTVLQIDCGIQIANDSINSCELGNLQQRRPQSKWETPAAISNLVPQMKKCLKPLKKKEISM
ncbi:sperm associated antigen 1-like protein [Camelus ferus]|nr:sperm associated antigen 1-like protein [Camelus ferus]